MIGLERGPAMERIVRRHQCVGCGACAGLMPQKYRMVDMPDVGRRPIAVNGAPSVEENEKLLAICPGAGAGIRPAARRDDRAAPPDDALWGPILEIWEGHATDPLSRWRGSSGGVATALASHALESSIANGVMHTRQKIGDALANETVISRSSAEVRDGAGSRYAPASACDRIAEIANPGQRIAFIGKPCDVQALSIAQSIDSRLDRNTALRVAVFCAGTPSTRGVESLLSMMKIPPGATVLDIKFRGEGWPGRMSAHYRSRDGQIHRSGEVDYAAGWGNILQKHRQWRCHLCADHTGEFADLSIGDPWDRPRGADMGAGTSLIVVRSARGRELVRSAIEAGAIVAFRRSNDALALAQPNLARGRRHLWGRLLGLRCVGLAAPNYRGWNLAQLWWREVSLVDKARSILGTVRRAWRRGLWRGEVSSESDRP